MNNFFVANKVFGNGKAKKKQEYKYHYSKVHMNYFIMCSIKC